MSTQYKTRTEMTIGRPNLDTVSNVFSIDVVETISSFLVTRPKYYHKTPRSNKLIIPGLANMVYLAHRAHSSGWESGRIMTGWSLVQFQVGPFAKRYRYRSTSTGSRNSWFSFLNKTPRENISNSIPTQHMIPAAA